MKIAIVQEHVDPRRGGAESSTLEMARALARLGVDVNILCAGGDSTPHVVDNVTFLPVRVSRGLKAVRTYRYVQGVLRACRRERFDIVHAITPVLCANVYQPRGGLFPETVERSTAMERSPVLRFFRRLGRDLNIRQRFLMRIERTLLERRADRVVVAALSAYVARQVRRWTTFPADRVHLVFNGVELDAAGPASVAARRAARDALGLPPDQPAVLFAAHNFRLKGLNELLAAVAHARRSAGEHPRLAGGAILVAGRDRTAAPARRAARLGIADAVRFLGPAAMPPLYAAADVLAHPTWYDPCSRVVLEALARGLPTVTTRWNGAAELIEANRHGVAIDEPSDIGALAAALEAALSPTTSAACRADAERVAARVSVDRHARELLALYERVVAGTTRGAEPSSGR